jgi:hypothetical protein
LARAATAPQHSPLAARDLHLLVIVRILPEIVLASDVAPEHRLLDFAVADDVTNRENSGTNNRRGGMN